MGKKDKKKGKGNEKTALKTEKKLNVKQKKYLAAIGEEDIEKIIAEIEAEESKRSEVKELSIDQPSRRANFTFCPHPLKDELVMFGGEYFNGQKTVVNNDLIFYNINKNCWTAIQAVSPPPPRCGHQMVALAKAKGQIWIFGGEFTNSTQNQFHHYKDLWVYHIGDKKWEKITSPNGPSPRSGHRMVVNNNCLIVFGGYHDNLRQYKYFNDVYSFDLDNYKWNKLVVSGIPPAPRSGCQMVSLPDGKILILGGYSKQTIKKDVDRGIIHSDAFLLTLDKNDACGLQWKWANVKIGGIKLSPRSGVTITTASSDLAYSFGGVFDEEENEEDINGQFFNDLNVLDLKKKSLRPVFLSGSKTKIQAKKRNKNKTECSDDEEPGSDEESGNEEKEEKIMEVTDGVFTLTVGPSRTNEENPTEKSCAPAVFQPSPRMNCGLVVKHGVLYLYGGIVEDGDKQVTLCDMYSLDLHKLDNWKTIIADEEAGADWISSDSETDEDEDEDEDETMDVN